MSGLVLRRSQIEALRYVKTHSRSDGMPCRIAGYADGARVDSVEGSKAPSPSRLNTLIRHGLLEAHTTGVSTFIGAVKLTPAGEAALLAPGAQR